MAEIIEKILARENVQTGGSVNAYGDRIDWFTQIMAKLPAKWIEAGNNHGSVFVRELNGRGFHLYINERIFRDIRYWFSKKMDLKPFDKFMDKIKVGDSILRINNYSKNLDGMMNVSIHECLHFLQRAIPGLDEYFKYLWIERTQGEKTRALASIQEERGEIPYYGEQEVGRRDLFVNVYYGKNYGTDANPKLL